MDNAYLPAASITSGAPVGSVPLPNSRAPMRPPKLFNMLYRGRWWIVGSTVLCLIAGIAYVTFTEPVYRSGLLIQVEQTEDTGRGSGGDPSTKPAATSGVATEIAILKSRMTMSSAVENSKLYIAAVPQYVPVIGWLMASRSNSPSRPLPGGYVYGAEQIDVPVFNVPPQLEGKPFDLTLGSDGNYTLTQAGTSTSAPIELHGKLGTLLSDETPRGTLELMVTHVTGNPGARFTLTRQREADATALLQRSVTVAEDGKDSGIIKLTLDGVNPTLVSRILNDIGSSYLEQNAKRKLEAAESSIQLIDEKLAERKAQLEASESRYNEFQAKNGPVDTGDERASLLPQSIADQMKVLELGERRQDLSNRNMADQPTAHAVDAALADAQTALASIAAKTRKLPLVEQNLLQLQRDLLIDSERYTNLLNAHRQLTLGRTASVPNVRILDWATAGQFQVESPRGLLIAGAAMSGAILGILLVFLRRTIVAGVEDPLDIEWDTGLPLLATVLRSPLNVDAMQDAPEGAQLELAPAHPRNEASVESLRTLRTTMQYVLADKGSRVVLLTGPTAGVGKSFLSANLAMLSGASNKRILLLDADLRKGVLHRYFRVARGPGLTDVIMGTHSIETVIHRNVAPGLDLLTAGADVISPSETLLRPELADLIELLSEQYDMVVMDGPPVLLVGDAIALGRAAGTVLLVARHGMSTTREIRESARRLGVADVQICGAVCNDFTPGLGRYGYPYGDEGYFRRLHHEARESAAAS